MLRAYHHSLTLGFHNLRSSTTCPNPFTPSPPPKPPNHVPALDGVRILALLWVLSFHSLYFLGSFHPSPYAHSLTSLCSAALFCRPIVNGHLAVDVFFTLSGFLVASNLHGPHFQGERRYGDR